MEPNSNGFLELTERQYISHYGHYPIKGNVVPLDGTYYEVVSCSFGVIMLQELHD